MIMRSLRRRTVAALGTAGLALGTAAAVAQPAAAAPDAARSTYIVMLTSQPVSTYAGGLPGLSATAPRAQGEKILRANPRVQAYRAYLDRVRDSVLAAAPGAERL